MPALSILLIGLYCRSIVLQIPLVCLIMSLYASIGMTMTAYYIGCDPLENGEIEKSDQVGSFIRPRLSPVVHVKFYINESSRVCLS